MKFSITQMDQMDRVLLFQYTQILLGERAGVANEFKNQVERRGNNKSGPKNRAESDKNYETIIKLLHFAFDIFLRWTPERVLECTTKEILQQMKVYDKLSALKKYIPSEFIRMDDYSYIAYMLYEDELMFDHDHLTVMTYKDVLNGKLPRFPKGYFNEPDGRKRACVCLQYCITHFLSFRNSKEMYEYFSDPNSVNVLVKKKLKLAFSESFDSPVKYLHETLSPSQRDDYLYHYYEFLYQMKKSVRCR